MSFKSNTRSAWTQPLLLATMFCLVGCGTLQGISTRTSATEALEPNIADLCRRAWVPVTYSGKDTDQTQLEVKAINAARATYCGESGR